MSTWLPIAVSTVAAAGTATSATFTGLVVLRQRRTAVRDKYIDIVSDLIDALLQLADMARLNGDDAEFIRASRARTSNEFRTVCAAIAKLQVLESALRLGDDDAMDWLTHNANNLAANVHQVDMHGQYDRIANYGPDSAADLRPAGVSDEGWETLSHSRMYSLGTSNCEDSPLNSDIYSISYEKRLRIYAAELDELGIEYTWGEAAARAITYFVNDYLTVWANHVVANKLR